MNLHLLRKSRKRRQTGTRKKKTKKIRKRNLKILGSSKGTVDLFSEEHPNGDISLWYRFVDEDGNEWTSFAVNEDDPYPNDIYSEQDSAMHFMRSASEAQYTREGMGDVYGYFFVGTWECDGYVMEIFDNGNNSYFVSIESPEINNEVRVWADHEDPSHQDMVFVSVSD